jgi:carboxyl-terminal processing protease
MFPTDADHVQPTLPEAAPATDPATAPATTPETSPALAVPVTPVVTARPRRLTILPLAIAIVAVLGGGALFMSGYMLGQRVAAQPGTPSGQDQAFQPFWDTYDTIVKRYAGGEVDRKVLVEGAIKGMIDALGDPYSSYLTSEQYRESLLGISGQFEGIGAEIATQAPDGTQGCSTLGPECRLVIIAPIDGSPALAAGLRAGDLVLAADGTSLDGLNVDGARDRIRGPKGTVVTLTIQRGSESPFDLEITRDIIQQREVTTRELADGTIGYIRLSGFSDNGADELEAALKADIAAGRTKIILDLRGNPGGYVTAAREVASQFIGSGPVFWEEIADGRQEPTEAVPGGAAIDASIKVVCLIDGGSASASEIVAGALQDTGRATLVGETSFGKGTVQQWQELTGEGGAFRLTIAKWLTPDKRWIHNVGLVPDVPVTIPDDIAPDTDPVLDKAVELLGGAPAVAGLARAA